LFKLGKTIAKDYARSLIIYVISAAIAIPLICALIFIPLAIASRTDDTTSALLIMVIPAICLLLIMFGGAAGTLFFAFGREPLELSDPELSGITVFAQDEGWAVSLLINPEVKALLPQLILSESPFLMRQIHLEPGKLRLFLYRNKGLFKFSITPEQAEQWLNGLLSLAHMAESLPDPQ
jgi:hypothetical protein